MVTAIVVLLLLGKLSLAPQRSGGGGAVFYVVPYLYGYAFYDSDFSEIETMEVKAGDTVTLYIVPSHALSKEAVLEYAERTRERAIGGLAPGDPEIRKKILEDLELGNIEHIIGISAHPVYAPTNVTPALGGQRFRQGGPKTVREAVLRGDPAIKTVTFTAKKIGAFDVLCIDSGTEGASTCGWGHKWMVAKGTFVVRR